MLNTPISIPDIPLESLFQSRRSPMNAENNFRREDLSPLQNHISSLYEPDPFPGITFHDNSKRWEYIAKEILTPFAPKYPLYNWRKFVPLRHQSTVTSIQSPVSSLVDSKNLNGPKQGFSRQVSFKIQHPNRGKSGDEKQFFKKSFSGSQTTRHQARNRDEYQALKRTSLMKKFLNGPQPFQNVVLDAKQLQAKREIRPQTVTTNLKKEKIRSLFGDANWDNLGKSSDESKNDTSESSVEESKSKSNKNNDTLSEKRVTIDLKAQHREVGKLVQQRSRKSIFVPAGQSFCRRSSVRGGDDTRFSFFLQKLVEEENAKPKPDKKAQLRIRRKSDTSSYSGGECLKLTKHMDIILPSDSKKRKIPKKSLKPVNPINLKQEDAITNFLLSKPKRKIGPISRTEGTSSKYNNSPRNSLNIPMLETFNSAPPVKVSNFEPKTPVDSALPKPLKPLDFNLRTKSMSTNRNRPPQLGPITPLSPVTNRFRIFGLEELSTMKSRTPGSRDTSKAVSILQEKEVQTARNARHGKASFEKRLKNGDLSEALKVVLDLNKKAEKTVFRKKSSEKLKTLRPALKLELKEYSRCKSKGFLESPRTLSPGLKKTASVKNSEIRGLPMFVTENVKEEAVTQKKRKPRKKIAFLTLRSKSVPKINALPALEKIYSP